MTVIVVLLAVLMITLTAGCGGGGGGSASSMQGVANIHANSVRPVATFVYLDASDNLVTDTTADIEPSTSGWQDKPFQLPYPESSASLWAIVAFNDIAIRDNIMQESELLGFSIMMLKRSSNGFSIINGNTGLVAFADANDAQGKNVWIDCTFDRSAPISAQIKERIKALK